MAGSHGVLSTDNVDFKIASKNNIFETGVTFGMISILLKNLYTPGINQTTL